MSWPSSNPASDMINESARSGEVGVDADLDLMFAQVKALRQLGSDAERSGPSARVYDFSIRWGTLLHGRLQRLVYYHRQGRLAPHEQERYELLRGELRDVLPLLERLRLAQPSVALDDGPVS